MIDVCCSDSGEDVNAALTNAAWFCSKVGYGSGVIFASVGSRGRTSRIRVLATCHPSVHAIISYIYRQALPTLENCRRHPSLIVSMTCFAQYLCIYIVLSPSDSLQGKGVADRPTGESDALVKEEDRL